MTWFKVDDSFTSHRKVLSIPRKDRMSSLGLWLSGATWSARHLEDGRVPKYVIEELGGLAKHSDLLVKAGLWIDKGDHYLFHDWEDWQVTKAEVDHKRQEETERKRKWREAKKAQEERLSRRDNDGTTGSVPRDMSHASGNVPSTDPIQPDPTRSDTDPTQSDPIVKEENSSSYVSDARGVSEIIDLFASGRAVNE